MTRIAAIASFLPETIVSNSQLQAENPSWDIDNVQSKSGVVNRHVAGPKETSFDMAVRACDRLFEQNQISADSIDAIIFCTQSPDFIMPSNSHLLHRHYEMGQGVVAFDMNLACSGFVY